MFGIPWSAISLKYLWFDYCLNHRGTFKASKRYKPRLKKSVVHANAHVNLQIACTRGLSAAHSRRESGNVARTHGAHSTWVTITIERFAWTYTNLARSVRKQSLQAARERPALSRTWKDPPEYLNRRRVDSDIRKNAAIWNCGTKRTRQNKKYTKKILLKLLCMQSNSYLLLIPYLATVTVNWRGQNNWELILKYPWRHHIDLVCISSEHPFFLIELRPSR